MRNLFRQRLLLCLALSSPACVLAQSQELLKAEAWEGKFSLHANGSGQDSHYNIDTTWSYDAGADGTFVLDKFVDDTPPTWSGHWSGTAHFHWKNRETSSPANCLNEEESTTDGTITNPNPKHGDIDLRLHEDGWELRIWRNKLPATYVRSCVFPDGHKHTDRLPTAEFIPFGSPVLDYAATGSTLSATYTVHWASGLGTQHQDLQSVPWQAEVQIWPQGDLVCEPLRSACDRVSSWKQCAESSIDGLQGDLGGAQAQLDAEFATRSSSPQQRALWEPQYLQIKQHLGDLLIYVVKLRADLAVQAMQAQADCALLPGPANRKECDAAAHRVDEGLKKARQKAEGDFDGPQLTALMTVLQAQGSPWPSAMTLLARMQSRQKLIHQCPS